MGIPLDKAELLSLFFESITYGIFASFFVILIAISRVKGPIRIANQLFVLPLAALMMVLATTHIMIDCVRLVQGFVTGDPERLPNPVAYYEQIAHPLHVGKTVIYVLQTILGDGVLVWRCYMVNNKSLYVLIPATIVLCASLATGMAVAGSLSTALPKSNIFQTAAGLTESFFILTMCLDVCCTASIVFKIWQSLQRTTFNSSRTIFPIMAIIIESGAIYTTSIIALLISYLSGSNGRYPALDLITPLVGVTYCLIILQIHFQLRFRTSSPPARASATTTLSHNWANNNRRAPTYQLRSDGVAVHIAEHAEAKIDPGPPDAINRKVRLQ